MSMIPYPDFPEHLRGQLQRVIACSPFAAGLIERYPEEFKSLVNSGSLENAGLGIAQPETGTADFDAALRRFRNLAMLRIIWRDLNAAAGLDDSLADLTDLAETCIQHALDHHSALLAKKYGTPVDSEGEEQELIVIAMGKLGGRELNLSSDIDLVFVYPGDGETRGERKLSATEFFTRLTRAVIGSLSAQSEEGFVFRVDTRLRPYGLSGPLVVSEAAIEQYYQREGRGWERYALIKARPVAGDRGAGAALLQRLRPFVYRRYVDFGVFEELREMANKISDEASRRGWQDDIKRGPGGIREAEFFIQSFQLLRGGKESSLQTTSFYKAAAEAAGLGLVDGEVIRQLTDNYNYLRLTENRLQALHDQQTHKLPESHANQAALSTAMGHDNWQDFLSAIERCRTSIRATFDTLARPDADDVSDRGMVLWSLLISQDEPMEPLAGEISGDAEAVGPLLSYRRFLEKAALSQRARQRLEKLMPQLLARLAKNPLPYRPLNHVLDLVRAISRRSAYLVLLSENPAVMDRLLTLFAQSDWIAEQVIRYPLLLDELLDPGLAEDLPRREELAESLARSVRLDHDDGQQLMAMNEFKLGTLLRIAIAQLEQRIDICTAQQLLTELAEILIERALQLAAAALSDRFPDAGKIEFGIIAYGTLGARELGYQSDLDLIFLYQQENPSAWSADNEKYAIRLSQRLLTYLASQTTSGALYTVDTRLRPNGGSGSLVSSLQAFKDYQSNDSWTWEQQALTRARWIAGSAAVLPAFEEIRQSVCGSPRQPDELKREIIAMRSRIRKEKSIVGTHDVDFKHGQGGLLDIEFICQYGVLLKSVESPALLGTTNTLGQINLLQSAGFLQPDDAEALAAAWLTYSHARHFVALTNFRASASFSPHMDFVGGLWSRLFDAEERAPAAQ